MEKSIETIWTEGFSKKEDLLTPKIDKLNKQKSKLIIEKIDRRFSLYNFSIIPSGLLFAIGFAYAGYVVLGVYILFIMLAFFFINKKIWKSFKKININTNSYEYLLAFRNGIKKMISFYTKVYAIGSPIIIFPAYWLYFSKTGAFQEFIAEVQTPYIILFLIILALVLSVLTVLAYKLEVKIIYGRLIKKLDKIIADMEELKNYIEQKKINTGL